MFSEGRCWRQKSFVQARNWYAKAAAQNNFDVRCSLAATPLTDPPKPLKGELAIKKSVSPSERESLGIKLVNMLEDHRKKSNGKPVDMKKVSGLITNGADLNVVVGETTMMRNGKPTVTKSGGTSLEKAVELKDPELVELLMANGADAHAHYFHLFHSFLYSVGRTGRERSNEPPQFAKQNREKRDKSMKIASLLMTYGINPNSWDRGGNTWLYWACIGGSSTMIDLMVQYGADVNLPSDISRSSDPHNPYNNGKSRSPIYNAISMNQVDAVRAILKHNPNLAFKDADGKTPLDYAYEVRANHQANPAKRTSVINGKKTVKLISEDLVKKLDEIIAMLEAAGAKRSS